MAREADVKLSINQLFELTTISAIASSQTHQATSSQTPCLVPLKPGRGKSPLFLIHAIGSSILFYRPLVERLQSDRAIYGIQSAFLKFPTAKIDSVEALATRYIQQIQQVQPEGPYAIGGASFGGLVAYEVARQLKLQHQTVEIVILFDRSAPGHYQRANVWRRYRHYWQQFVALGPSYVVTKLKRRFRTRSRRATGNFDRDRRQLARKLDRPGQKYLGNAIVERQTRLTTAYRPEAYPGEIVLIRAQQGRDDGSIREADLGWSQYALSGVRVWDNPGKHMSIFKSPNVDTLAQTLDSLLNDST
ncbi:MAG: thioesterase domain-containing protein, partial [Cyanobacteria bacterium J06648_11]